MIPNENPRRAPSDEPIGFVGLGSIGLPMAGRLLDCGGSLVVWNRTAAKTDELVARGASRVATPSELASRVDIVLSCLHGPAADREVFFGTDGFLSADVSGTLFVNTSTNGPECARELALAAEAVGAEYLDCALMGQGPLSAAAGRLVLPVSGSVGSVMRARPVLELLATTIEHVGDVGAAQVVKLANNAQVAVHAASLAEALRFAVTAGVDPGALSRLLRQGSSRSRAMDLWMDAMLKGEHGSHGSLRTLGKDNDLAVAFAAKVGEPANVAAAAAEVFARALANSPQGDVPSLIAAD